MGMLPKKFIDLGVTVSTGSKLEEDAQAKSGSAQHKPSTTRNNLRQKKIQNLNDLMSPRANIDDALSCSSQSGATADGYNDAATLMMTDIDIFGKELNQLANILKESFMEKRRASGRMKDEPLEELEEVYAEISTLEDDFKKALGISQHLLSHSRQLLTENQELTFNMDALKHDNQLMEEHFTSHRSVTKQQEEIWGQRQEQSKKMEEELAALKEELHQKDRALLEK